MARLMLRFDSAVLQEVPIAGGPIRIGRAPDNDIRIDNLAVSNYHARVYAEADRLVVEDLESLNGTFVNDLRVERALLHDGDSILIGKHHIVVDAAHDAAPAPVAGRKVAAPKVDETMMLDTKQRREMFQQALAVGERTQPAPARTRVPCLVVLSGKTDQENYQLSNKLTVIGKSTMATVRLRGWFAPQVAAQISRRDDGYYLGRGDQVPKVNGNPIPGPTRLNDGDLIEVGGVQLNFLYHD
ncbi:MAG TPA: FHA domain-containing protein [Candidatus Acidoferrales bacterium]|nr:FHA domain-containing protein [Candidatus Acidoferrales bacterium]